MKNDGIRNIFQVIGDALQVAHDEDKVGGNEDYAVIFQSFWQSHH